MDYGVYIDGDIPMVPPYTIGHFQSHPDKPQNPKIFSKKLVRNQTFWNLRSILLYWQRPTIQFWVEANLAYKSPLHADAVKFLPKRLNILAVLWRNNRARSLQH
jgi:hypothetical protein